MKKHQRYVIGIDGGGTKTIAALADLEGKILSKNKSGSSSPRNAGIKEVASNLREVLKPLLRKVKKGQIVSTAIALPAIEEEYREKKKEILARLMLKKEIYKIFKGKVKIFSDQLAAFKSGTDKKDGVLLIAGTGCVCHGWKKRKEAKSSGWGWLADEGSSFWIGQKAFQAVLKDLDRRGQKTMITRLTFQSLQVQKITHFLKKIYSQNPTEIIPQLTIICDKASQKGDKVAKEIMAEAGQELALNTKTVIKRLNFQKEKFPLVLVGSMFKSKIVLDIAKRKIKRIAPKVQFIQPKEEPVKGAIKLALYELK